MPCLPALLYSSRRRPENINSSFESDVSLLFSISLNPEPEAERVNSVSSFIEVRGARIFSQFPFRGKAAGKFEFYSIEIRKSNVERGKEQILYVSSKDTFARLDFPGVYELLPSF